MQDDSEAEYVGRRVNLEVRVVGICDDYFGCHEAGGATPFVQVRWRIRPGGQSEVADGVIFGVVNFVCAFEQDVLGLQVAVHDAPVGKVGQAGQEAAA